MDDTANDVREMLRSALVAGWLWRDAVGGGGSVFALSAKRQQEMLAHYLAHESVAMRNAIAAVVRTAFIAGFRAGTAREGEPTYSPLPDFSDREVSKLMQEILPS
jgi:hypothetical protein